MTDPVLKGIIQLETYATLASDVSLQAYAPVGQHYDYEIVLELGSSTNYSSLNGIFSTKTYTCDDSWNLTSANLTFDTTKLGELFGSGEDDGYCMRVYAGGSNGGRTLSETALFTTTEFSGSPQTLTTFYKRLAEIMGYKIFGSVYASMAIYNEDSTAFSTFITSLNNSIDTDKVKIFDQYVYQDLIETNPPTGAKTGTFNFDGCVIRFPFYYCGTIASKTGDTLDTTNVFKDTLFAQGNTGDLGIEDGSLPLGYTTLGFDSETSKFCIPLLITIKDSQAMYTNAGTHGDIPY